MTNIIDQLVLADDTYSTEHTGGKKIAVTDLGTIFIALKKSNGYVIRMSTNGTTFTTIKNETSISDFRDIAICTVGEFLHVAFTYNTTLVYFCIDSSGNIIDSKTIDTSLQKFNVSLTASAASKELHLFWEGYLQGLSKNNLLYIKGSINPDNTVTFGIKEEWTNVSYSIDGLASTMVGNSPVAAFSIDTANYSSVIVMSSDLSLPSGPDGSYKKKYKEFVSDISYLLRTPSLDVRTVNGVTRLGVVFSGQNSSHIFQVKSSYSEDFGANWGAIVTETNSSADCLYPSLNYDREGKRFITYQVSDMVRVKKESGDQGIAIGTTFPNTAIATSFFLKDSIVVYKKTTGVYFSGNWVSQNISPAQGERGRILNRQNVLTYNITSDSTIGTVTEKINGVVVGTKALNSGQNTTINITQAQWDAIPYGKYQNNNAARNTIEIVTSAATFRYTFEKWIDNTADILSSIKAVKDSKDYYLPSAKKILSDAINAKGGSTTPTDSIERMAGFVTSGGGVKRKEGTSISTSALESFTNGVGSATSSYSITLDFSVLGFVPKNIIYFNTGKSTQTANAYISEKYYINGNNYADVLAALTNGSSVLHLRAIIDNQTIKLPVNHQATTIKWIAYE